GALIVLDISLSINKSKPKKTKAVIGLSIKLAICPPGAPVVNAEITPVSNAISNTYFGFGNNKIHKNIIDSNMSDIIPNNIDGMIICYTVKFLSLIVIISKFIVFI